MLAGMLASSDAAPRISKPPVTTAKVSIANVYGARQ